MTFIVALRRLKPVQEQKQDGDKGGAVEQKEGNMNLFNIPSLNKAAEETKTGDEDQEMNTDSKAHILMYSKNKETLDEFELRTHFTDAYLDQLERWIKKKKYVCTPIADDEDRLYELHVVVGDCFSFVLRKLKKSDLQLLNEEYEILKKQNEQIKKEWTLFNMIFFNYWKEKMRGHNMGTVESMFRKIKAKGHVDEHGHCYLALTEKLLGKEGQDMGVSGQIKGKVDAFIWANGSNNGMVQIAEKSTPVDININRQLHMHQVDYKVTPKTSYTVYVPKF